MDVLIFETCWVVNSEIIKQVTSSWYIFIQLTSVEITTKFDILHFKLAPYCDFSVISFGAFPGVWIFCADVSEHSVSSIFIGRFLLKRRWNRKCVPKYRHRKFRRREITQQKNTKFNMPRTGQPVAVGIARLLASQPKNRVSIPSKCKNYFSSSKVPQRFWSSTNLVFNG